MKAFLFISDDVVVDLSTVPVYVLFFYTTPKGGGGRGDVSFSVSKAAGARKRESPTVLEAK